jgi:hypothetical protein
MHHKQKLIWTVTRQAQIAKTERHRNSGARGPLLFLTKVLVLRFVRASRCPGYFMPVCQLAQGQAMSVEREPVLR